MIILGLILLKSKAEVYGVFKVWCEKVDNEKGCKIKNVRTDNGMEFLSTEFQNYCKLKGISRHTIIPSNPRQNWRIERMNQTVLDKVRCMLVESGLPKQFWREAVTTAACMVNKSPSTALSFEIPDEVLVWKTSKL